MPHKPAGSWGSANFRAGFAQQLGRQRALDPVRRELRRPDRALPMRRQIRDEATKSCRRESLGDRQQILLATLARVQQDEGALHVAVHRQRQTPAPAVARVAAASRAPSGRCSDPARRAGTRSWPADRRSCARSIRVRPDRAAARGGTPAGSAVPVPPALPTRPIRPDRWPPMRCPAEWRLPPAPWAGEPASWSAAYAEARTRRVARIG